MPISIVPDGRRTRTRGGRVPILALTLLFASLAVGPRAQSTPAARPPAGYAAAPAALRPLLAAFPADVGVLIVVHPDRVGPLTASLEAALQRVRTPAPGRDPAHALAFVEVLLERPHPVATLLRRLDLPGPVADAAARLVDAQRPTIAAPFLADLAEAARFLDAGALPPPGVAPAGWHTRVVLPSDQPLALAQSLAEALRSSGATLWAEGALVPTLAGARVLRTAGARYAVVVDRECVRLERLVPFRPDTDEARVVRSFLAVAAVPSSRAPQLGARWTPALAHAFREPSLAALWTTPGGMARAAAAGDFGAALTTGLETRAALGSPLGPGAPIDLVVALWDAAAATLVDAWWLGTDPALVAEDVAVTLGSGPDGHGLLVQSVTTLTEAGRAVVAAAEEGPLPLPRLRTTLPGDPVVSLTLTADLSAASLAAPLPRWAVCTPAEQRSDPPLAAAARLLGDCGSACGLQALAFGPWTLLRGLHERPDAGAPAVDLIPHAPRGARLVAIAGDTGVTLAWGLALALPAGHAPDRSPDRWQGLLDEVARGGPGPARRLRFESAEDETGTIVRITLDAPPGGLFAAARRPVDRSTLATLAVDGDRLSAAVRDDLPAVAAWAALLGPVRGRAIHHRDTLVVQIVAALDGAPSPFPAPPTYAGTVQPLSAWRPPEAAGAGLLCAPREAASATALPVGVAPGLRGPVLREALRQLDARARDLAGADPRAGLETRRSLALVARSLAWRAALHFDRATADDLWRTACAAGDAVACGDPPERPARLAFAAGAALAERPFALALASTPAFGDLVVVTAAGATWNGGPLSELAAGRSRPAGDGWPASLDRRGAVLVVVDAAAPSSAWGPVFGALRAAAIEDVALLLGAGEGSPGVVAALLAPPDVDERRTRIALSVRADGSAGSRVFGDDARARRSDPRAGSHGPSSECADAAATRALVMSAHRAGRRGAALETAPVLYVTADGDAVPWSAFAAHVAAAGAAEDERPDDDGATVVLAPPP